MHFRTADTCKMMMCSRFETQRNLKMSSAAQHSSQTLQFFQPYIFLKKMPTCRSAPPLPGSCPARYGSVIIQLESQFCYRASSIAKSKRSDSVTMCELLVDGWLVLTHGALQNKTMHSNGNVRRKQPSKGSSGNFLKRRYISGNIRE